MTQSKRERMEEARLSAAFEDALKGTEAYVKTKEEHYMAAWCYLQGYLGLKSLHVSDKPSQIEVRVAGLPLSEG